MVWVHPEESQRVLYVLPYVVTMNREVFGLCVSSGWYFLWLDSFGCFSCCGFSHKQVCVSELQYLHSSGDSKYFRQVAEVASNFNLDEVVNVLSRPSIEILLCTQDVLCPPHSRPLMSQVKANG
jgi:hypothetical protein